MPHSKKIREEQKKFHEEPKKIYIGDTEIEKKGNFIASCCLFYDITPGGSHNATETFAEFVELLILCSEKKLYNVRDGALKRILKNLTE